MRQPPKKNEKYLLTTCYADKYSTIVKRPVIMPSIYSNDRISVYIPLVSNFHDKYSITDTFNDHEIGQVDRVDFVENKSSHSAYSVFIHFFPYDTQIMHEIIGCHSIKSAFRLDVSRNEFWWICQADNTLPDTLMNMHQAAKYIRTLEEKVEELTRRLEQVEVAVIDLEEKDNVSVVSEIPEWEFDDNMPPLTMEDLATDFTPVQPTQEVAPMEVVVDENVFTPHSDELAVISPIIDLVDNATSDSMNVTEDIEQYDMEFEESNDITPLNLATVFDKEMTYY